MRSVVQAVAYQASLPRSSALSYHGSFAEFRKCGFIGMRNYMVEQLKVRGWSGHCFWRQGDDQWELIGIADNSVSPPSVPFIEYLWLARRFCKVCSVVKLSI